MDGVHIHQGSVSGTYVTYFRGSVTGVWTLFLPDRKDESRFVGPTGTNNGSCAEGIRDAIDILKPHDHCFTDFLRISTTYPT